MSASILHLLVKGRVQGVGFRWFVADEARRLDLSGWVRNNSNGSVELCARGDEAALAALKKIVEKGPAGASVSSVELVQSAPDSEMPHPFAIARA